MNKREAKRAELQARLDANKEAKAAAKAAGKAAKVVDPAKQAAIDDALNRISGIGQFLSKREIKELPSVLWDGELPLHVVDGRYNGGFGILVATDRRLVFVDKGLFSLKVEDFPYDRISSIEARTGMVMGQMTIYAAGNKEEIQHVPERPSASVSGLDTRQNPGGKDTTPTSTTGRAGGIVACRRAGETSRLA